MNSVDLNYTQKYKNRIIIILLRDLAVWSFQSFWQSENVAHNLWVPICKPLALKN